MCQIFDLTKHWLREVFVLGCEILHIVNWKKSSATDTKDLFVKKVPKSSMKVLF